MPCIEQVKKCKEKLKELNICDIKVIEFLAYGVSRKVREVTFLQKRKHEDMIKISKTKVKKGKYA